MLLCYFTFVNSMGQFSTFVTKTPPQKEVFCRARKRCAERTIPYSVWFASGSVSLRTMGSTR